MSLQDSFSVITFKAGDISVEQTLLIHDERNRDTNLSTDDIVKGLNSGSLIPNMSFTHNPEDGTCQGTWIRDSSGNGVALVIEQKVTVDNFNNFEVESISALESLML